MTRKAAKTTAALHKKKASSPNHRPSDTRKGSKDDLNTRKDTTTTQPPWKDSTTTTAAFLTRLIWVVRLVWLGASVWHRHSNTGGASWSSESHGWWWKRSLSAVMVPQTPWTTAGGGAWWSAVDHVQQVWALQQRHVVVDSTLLSPQYPYKEFNQHLLSALPPLLRVVLEPLVQLMDTSPLLASPEWNWICLSLLWGLLLQGMDYCLSWQLEALGRALWKRQPPPPNEAMADEHTNDHPLALTLDAFYWHTRQRAVQTKLQSSNHSQQSCSPKESDTSNTTPVVPSSSSSPASDRVAWWTFVQHDWPTIVRLAYWVSPITMASSSGFGSHQALAVATCVGAMRLAATATTAASSWSNLLASAVALAVAAHLDVGLVIYAIPVVTFFGVASRGPSSHSWQSSSAGWLLWGCWFVLVFVGVFGGLLQFVVTPRLGLLHPEAVVDSTTNNNNNIWWPTAVSSLEVVESMVRQRWSLTRVGPSLSILWYTQMESFVRFSTYFQILLAGLPYLLVLPAALRLCPHAPMTLTSIYWLVGTLLRPVTTLYDWNVAACLVALSLVESPIFLLWFPPLHNGMRMVKRQRTTKTTKHSTNSSNKNKKEDSSPAPPQDETKKDTATTKDKDNDDDTKEEEASQSSSSYSVSSWHWTMPWLIAVIAFCALWVPISLFVLLHSLWLETGNGEANFVFFQCLALNVLATLLVVLYVHGIVQWDKLRHLWMRQRQQEQKETSTTRSTRNQKTP